MANLTNKELLNKFEQDMRFSLEDLADNTIAQHIRYVSKFLDMVNKPAFDISKNEISAYVHGLQKLKGGDMNIDAKQNHLTSIKRFYKFLFEDSDDRDILQMRVFFDDKGYKHDIINPTSNIGAVNTSAKAKLLRNPRKEGLTTKDTQMLINELVSNIEYSKKHYGADRQFLAQRDYAMILMMLETGLRYSDIFSIPFHKRDITDNVLIVTVQKTKKQLRFFLSDYLMDAILKYQDMHNARSEYLFCAANGNAIANNAANKIIAKHCKRAGIEKEVSCHVLRHTCGALMYAETKDLAFVKELLGHSSVTTTQRYVYSEDIVKDMAKTTAKVTEKMVSAT